jgi:putative protein-disulfide isomerase
MVALSELLLETHAIMKQKNDMLDAEFLYFTDPMCSWCYGFAPVIRLLRTRYATIPMTIIPGGLRPNEVQPLPSKMAETIQHHWVSVQESTGQPFSFDFFQAHPAFVYNTLASCRGVVAAGRADPGMALPYLEEIQKRFYLGGEDPTSFETLCRAAETLGIAPREFEAVYHAPETEEALQAGMRRFQGIGAMGFPTLVLRTGDRQRLVAIGYQRFEHLEKIIDTHLAGEKTARGHRSA